MNYRYEKVLLNEEIAPNVWHMKTTGKEEPKPGQFYMLRRETHGSSVLLGRPISVSDWHEGELDFIYQVMGRGTGELADLKPGETVYQFGPQGNGFPLDAKGKIAIVAGGVGTAPMVYLAKKLAEMGEKPDVYLGFQDIPYAVEELRPYAGEVHLATESGRVGEKGRVTAVFSPAGYDRVYACGPNPMMEAVTLLCEKEDVPIYLSLENKMACAVGTCLLCTCRTKAGKSVRTCTEGPVIRGEEVDFHAGN